ncbi:MAG: hypothetical protein ABR976_14450 [Terracidiphilus sp.]|jgi:hypothetical protein
MKNVILAMLLLAPALVSADKPKPNAVDYTIAVHVQSSRIINICSDVTGGSSVCGLEQQLTVTIDGKKYVLQSGWVKDLLRVGDYKAKIVKDESQHPYEYTRVYEFLFPDNQTRQYTVTGESE